MLPGEQLPGVRELAGVHAAMVIEDDIYADLRSGALSELFTAGTGAGITPIGALGLRQERLTVGSGGAGPVAARLQATLAGIWSGQLPDPRGWLRVVRPGEWSRSEMRVGPAPARAPGGCRG